MSSCFVFWPTSFLMVSLQRTELIKNSGTIRRRLLRQLDFLKREWMFALVDDTTRIRGSVAEDVLKEGMAFEGRVTVGNPREAVRVLTN